MSSGAGRTPGVGPGFAGNKRGKAREGLASAGRESTVLRDRRSEAGTEVEGRDLWKVFGQVFAFMVIGAMVLLGVVMLSPRLGGWAFGVLVLLAAVLGILCFYHDLRRRARH